MLAAVWVDSSIGRSFHRPIAPEDERIAATGARVLPAGLSVPFPNKHVCIDRASFFVLPHRFVGMVVADGLFQNACFLFLGLDPFVV